MSEHHLSEVNDTLDESKFVEFEDSPFRLYQPYPEHGEVESLTAFDRLPKSLHSLPFPVLH
ncbi:hypothetical protein ACFQVB_36545 [Paraburkholderia humisilvae]|uniref:hypothetical protein n=1 Tax=Paraburkholderia humisilvae TaxID=627669 RepID=UPI00360E4300